MNIVILRRCVIIAFAGQCEMMMASRMRMSGPQKLISTVVQGEGMDDACCEYRSLWTYLRCIV